MMYRCPSCELPSEVQIVSIYPPRKLKCIHCGYQGIEQQFEVKNHGQETQLELTSSHIVHNQFT